MVTCEMLAPTSKLLFDNIPLSQASISQNLYFPQPHRYFSAHSGAVVKSAFSQRGVTITNNVSRSPRLSIGPRIGTIFKFKFTTIFKDVCFGMVNLQARKSGKGSEEDVKCSCFWKAGTQGKFHQEYPLFT